MFIEKENVLSEEQLKEILKLVKDFSFPWFYRPSTENNFYFNSHALLNPELGINSKHCDFFTKIFYKICSQNKVPVNKLLRMNVNMTFHYTAKQADLHTDHDFPHYVMILYLNNASGNTLIFNEQYEDIKGSQVDHERNWHKVQKEHSLKDTIVPEKNKVVFFNGINYHAQEFCKPNEERLVFLCTFQ